MGRKKRAIAPWSSREHALAECTKALGEEAAREYGEAFTVVLEPSDAGPDSDEFTPWVADILVALEQKHRVQLSGGVATMLWIASGARRLSSEDQFERSRKTWDEALRRARKRERFGGEAPYQWTARRIHDALVSSKLTYSGPPPKPTLRGTLARLEFELQQLGHAAERLSLREANALLRKVLQLRMALYRRKRG